MSDRVAPRRTAKSHRAEPLSWRALRHARKARKRQRRAAQPRLPGHAAADVSELRDPAYWRRLCPELHVADEDWCAAHMEPAALSAARREELQQDLRNQGFFILSPEELRWDEPPMRALCAAAAALRAHGWPATLLLMYDEAWWVCNRLSEVMRGVSGNANCFDILAWCVSAAAGESGFAPHRDRQPADVPGSFRSDGGPRYTTAWVALSEASARTGCLYLLPKPVDPGYSAGDPTDADADPLHVALRSDAAVQAVRACHVDAGGVVAFSHRVMHWGSTGDARAHTPRVSLSFGCSDGEFEPSYLRDPSAHLPFPRVGVRAALAGAQLINYHERFDFGAARLRALASMFRAERRHFSESYVQKTAAELKSAVEDRAKSNSKDEGAGAGAADDGDEDDEDDDALDDALDAMLDAQASSGANLFDDFDELESHR